MRRSDGGVASEENILCKIIYGSTELSTNDNPAFVMIAADLRVSVGSAPAPNKIDRSPRRMFAGQNLAGRYTFPAEVSDRSGVVFGFLSRPNSGRCSS